jgi:hypothetical protein
MNPQLKLITQKESNGTSYQLILHSVFEAKNSTCRAAGFEVGQQVAADGYVDIKLGVRFDSSVLFYEVAYPVVHSVPLDALSGAGNASTRYRVTVVDEQGNILGMSETGNGTTDPELPNEDARPIIFDGTN